MHLRTFPEIPDAWRNDDLAAKWAKIRNLRRVVTGALELERKEKRIGSSLQAHPVIYADAKDIAIFDDLDPAELFITSGATFTAGQGPENSFSLDDVSDTWVVAEPAAGEKCERCWKVLPDIGSNADHPTVCGRCADAVVHGSAATPVA